jgi:hypothetical protein
MQAPPEDANPTGLGNRPPNMRILRYRAAEERNFVSTRKNSRELKAKIVFYGRLLRDGLKRAPLAVPSDGIPSA